MERKDILINKIIIAAIYVLFTVGVIGHYFTYSRPLMTAITPFVLVLTYVLFLWSIKSSINKKFILVVASIFSLTFILEILGVQFGIVFGNYIYGEVLGPKILGVPLIIGINWVLVILGAISISKRITNNSFFLAFISGVLAVFFDMILEVVAVELKYWSWHNDVIPISNYLSWFMITAVSAYGLNYFKIEIKSQMPVHYFISQYLFFASLYVLIA